jgi:FecR protein
MNESDDDYLWNRTPPAEPDVARLEDLLQPLRHDAPLDELRLRRKSRAPWMLAIVAAAAAAVAFAWWQWPRASGACAGATGFKFKSSEGTVSCSGDDVAAGELPVGGVLETGKHRAELAIADIGTAKLGTATKIRLDRTSASGHHLYLEQGEMHARVTAPPRLFMVGTPHTEVTDLGCEYNITIDHNGAGNIQVLSGRVELQTAAGGFVVAPAHTRTQILAGRQPGIPVSDSASPAMLSAIDAYYRNERDSIQHILDAATAVDAITLINLAAVLQDVHAKRAALGRLAELVTPPVSVDDAVSNPGKLDLWRSDVVGRTTDGKRKK